MLSGPPLLGTAKDSWDSITSMKIDVSKIDQSEFYVNQHIIAGQVVYLIIPHQIGTKWTSENMIFRSSVWDSDGNPVSLSYKKFWNFGEMPELSPTPKTLDGTTIVDKIDGSTLIVSKFRDQFIIRTRGSMDVLAQPNASEIEILKKKYPEIFELGANLETWPYSIIMEWVTPSNKIVLTYPEVDFILTGIVNHDDYSLWQQSELDTFAKTFGMKRPSTYTFNSVDDLVKNVDKWDGREGVVWYHSGGQRLIKIKAAKYLFLHRMKSELSSLEKVIDVWISRGYPSYTDFYNYIQMTFDYELAEYCRGNISNICDGYKEVQQIIAHMKAFVEPLKTLPRRDAAMKIIASYGGVSNNRAAFCFKILDGKTLGGDDIKKLLFQTLKSTK